MSRQNKAVSKDHRQLCSHRSSPWPGCLVSVSRLSCSGSRRLHQSNHPSHLGHRASSNCFVLLPLSLIGLVDEWRGTALCGNGTYPFFCCCDRLCRLSHHRGQQQTPSKQEIAKVEFDSWLDDNQSLLAVTPLKLFRGQVSLGESQGYCAMGKAEIRQALSESVVGELPFSR